MPISLNFPYTAARLYKETTTIGEFREQMAQLFPATKVEDLTLAWKLIDAYSDLSYNVT